MLTVGITGDQGFLGWHLRCRLLAEKNIRTIGAGRQTFGDTAALREFAACSDVVVHFAGMNRGIESEIESTNVDLTQRLISACESAKVRPPIIFANSIHESKDTPYGRAKRRSAELLYEWAQKSESTFVNLVLPNLFGEFGRPFYNSVVATFCSQLAIGNNPEIIEDREIELLHAQDAADAIVKYIHHAEPGNARLAGKTFTVGSVMRELQLMNDQYRGHIIPTFRDSFDLALFNTLRSYFFPKYYPVNAPARVDARGSLFEAVKTLHGGQCFFSTTTTGATRGNHYHSCKIERFMVVQGHARIQVRRLFSNDIVEFKVTGNTPQYIDMPTFHTHNITNIGNGDLFTLFWAHEIFDPRYPDTYSELV